MVVGGGMGVSFMAKGSEEISWWLRMLTFSLSDSNYLCRAYHGFSGGI